VCLSPSLPLFSRPLSPSLPHPIPPSPSHPPSLCHVDTPSLAPSMPRTAVVQIMIYLYIYIHMYSRTASLLSLSHPHARASAHARIVFNKPLLSFSLPRLPPSHHPTLPPLTALSLHHALLRSLCSPLSDVDALAAATASGRPAPSPSPGRSAASRRSPASTRREYIYIYIYIYIKLSSLDAWCTYCIYNVAFRNVCRVWGMEGGMGYVVWRGGADVHARCTHTHDHALARAHIGRWWRWAECIHARMHARTLAHLHTHAHTHTHAQTHARAQTRPRMHAQTRPRMHARIHTHLHTRTHTAGRMWATEHGSCCRR
jgi:hypothetical protein